MSTSDDAHSVHSLSTRAAPDVVDGMVIHSADAYAELPSAKPTRSSQLSDVIDGALTTVPITVASVSLVYSSLPAQYLGMGVVAALLAMSLVHLISSATSRPMVYGARLFEATTLSAMMVAFAKQLPSWGLQGTPEQLLAVMCLVSALAAIVCALLHLAGADRFTRLIPSPVYVGFSISISILLLLSQSKTLYRLWQQGSPWMVLLTISLISIGVGLAVRRLRPRWPSTAMSIAAGTVVALAWVAAGSPVAMVMAEGGQWSLPWQVADFSSLLGDQVNRTALLTGVFYNSLLLSTVIFINTTVANEMMSQVDDRNGTRWQQACVALAAAVGGAAGSAPISSSTQAAMAATRQGPLTGLKALGIGLLCLFVALSGVVTWISLAGVAAAMMVDAYFIADRPAIKKGWAWLRGAKLETDQKEDLSLVALVTIVAVVLNVVAAVLIGLLFGLLLFALRNAKKPVRFTWTGGQLQSNCARGRGEIELLAAHGERIRILELEAELFFGSVASLDRHLVASLVGAHGVIVDWSRVRHVDSSIALALRRWIRAAHAADVRIFHAGSTLQGGNAASFLRQHFPAAQLFPDLDRALEAAESAVMASVGVVSSHHATQMVDALQIFHGLSDSQRSKLDESLPQRLFKAGDSIFSAGDLSNHMLIVLQGSAGVIVQGEGGRDIRITSVRRGGVLGEIGFLDEAPRSARVVAQEDLVAAVLTRDHFNQLRDEDPKIVTQLLTNLTLGLSTRLRHTNKLAVARNASS